MRISAGVRIESPVMVMEACNFGWGYDRVAEFRVGNKLLLSCVYYLDRSVYAYRKFRWDT
jgi:hypothetical protein